MSRFSPYEKEARGRESHDPFLDRLGDHYLLHKEESGEDNGPTYYGQRGWPQQRRRQHYLFSSALLFLAPYSAAIPYLSIN